MKCPDPPFRYPLCLSASPPSFPVNTLLLRSRLILTLPTNALRCTPHRIPRRCITVSFNHPTLTHLPDPLTPYPSLLTFRSLPYPLRHARNHIPNPFARRRYNIARCIGHAGDSFADCVACGAEGVACVVLNELCLLGQKVAKERAKKRTDSAGCGAEEACIN